MQLTSNDGNMVLDFYPIKDWDNTLIANYRLRVLSFMGKTMKKMIITDEVFNQCVQDRLDFGYKVTDCKDNLPQFHSWGKLQ
tara:strand:- start:406 stop:651 length:246 start_codon:yes stop_codon:yes gene_type:complete